MIWTGFEFVVGLLLGLFAVIFLILVIVLIAVSAREFISSLSGVLRRRTASPVAKRSFMKNTLKWLCFAGFGLLLLVTYHVLTDRIGYDWWRVAIALLPLAFLGDMLFRKWRKSV